jgi:flagellar assembly protein FliH
MTAKNENSSVANGRWVRPATVREDETAERLPSAEAVEASLLARARDSVSELVALEREIEARIRERWEAAEARICAERAVAEIDREAKERELEGRTEDARIRAEAENRERGYLEGHKKGRDEGRREGFDEGRDAGWQAGVDGGRRSGEEEARSDLSRALEIFRAAARKYDEERRLFLDEARREVVKLALEVGRTLVKREVRDIGDPAKRNIEKAVALIFRRGEIVVEIHPDDVDLVEQALAEGPRWAEELDGVQIKSASDVARGGCRLIAGAGVVDLDIDTQIELISETILGEPRSERAAARTFHSEVRS